ncbi:MAG TPA: hypothetical protein VH519_15110 [Hyphomicrobiaceae bacterium]|jgi:hypothetical protein
MPDPMRDYFEERERTLEKRIAEFEAALFQIIAQGGKGEAIARAHMRARDPNSEVECASHNQ